MHTVLSEVRGLKMEDAKSVSDLFATWAETAGAQAELESDSEVESQEEIQKMLRDARQQLSGDFKQHICQNGLVGTATTQPTGCCGVEPIEQQLAASRGQRKDWRQQGARTNGAAAKYAEE